MNYGYSANTLNIVKSNVIVKMQIEENANSTEMVGGSHPFILSKFLH